MNERKPSQDELEEAARQMFELLRPWFDAIVKFYNDLGACLMDVLRDPRVQEQIRSTPEFAEFQALID